MSEENKSETRPEPEYDMSEMDDYYARTRRPLLKNPTTFLGRMGCGALLVLWFALLLTPCMLFWLATGNDLVIGRNTGPEPDQHPILQVDLIMEIDNRGLKIMTTSIHDERDNAVCMQGNINYLLWQSDESAAPAQYCQCYTRENNAAEWVFISQESVPCIESTQETLP